MAERYITKAPIAEEDWLFLDQMERHNAVISDLDLNVFWRGKCQKKEENSAPSQATESSPRPRKVQRRATKKGPKR
jgi:hypothetical protein